MNRELSEQTEASIAPVSNTVALIGVILLGVAIGLCGLLLVQLDHLPDGVEEVRKLNATGPAQLRLLILVCAAGVLNVVAFLLCSVGLLLPNRPRILASIGTAGSLLLLLGILWSSGCRRADEPAARSSGAALRGRFRLADVEFPPRPGIPPFEEGIQLAFRETSLA